jgi:outer membrane protein assembly factor BamB
LTSSLQTTSSIFFHLQSNPPDKDIDMKFRLAMTLIVVCLQPVIAFELPTAKSGDWPWWRGPGHNGIAETGQSVPTQWSDSENVIWKVKVPGRGHSSPTVVGNRIFLATANEQQQIQGVVAFDRKTGKVLWQTAVSRGGFPKTHTKNTHATCTVACDGKRVYVVFHHHAKLTLAALSINGDKLWAKDVGPFDPRKFEYGYAPSPILYDNTVIIAADYEKGGYLAAYDRVSGKNVWMQQRPRKLSFSSPVIANISGHDQLLISGCDVVASYNPKNGQPLWSTPGTTMATCGTVVWDSQSETVFASGGYPKPETIAIKADGSKTVVWRNRQKCYEQSMLLHDGYLYGITDVGIGFCWRASDGKEMWKTRLSAPISASPVLVGDTIFQSAEDGTTYVFKADPKGFELVAKNRLGDEAFATPVFAGNRIYARVADRSSGRRQEYLYCIGEQ